MAGQPSCGPRGGWRQRLEDDLATRTVLRNNSRSRPRSPRGARVPPSKLSRGLLNDWAWGVISAERVQRTCSNAVEDGVTHPLVKKLANLGAPQHCASRLLRMFSSKLSSRLVVECLGSKQNQVIYPHAVFGAIVSLSRVHFRRRFGANRCALRNFWTMYFSTPEGKRHRRIHPQLKNKTPSDLETTVALTLHNDAGPVSRALSV